MKKPLIALGITMLLAAGAYAQTQRVNRTNTRTHDRSDAVGTDKTTTDRPDRMNHRTDVDRNNPNNNTNSATPNSSGTTDGNKTNGTGTNGTNTNGGTGTNGSNINTNNPR